MKLDPLLMNATQIEKCRALTTHKMRAEYIWLDSMGSLRSKVRILDANVPEIPVWHFDGSSTGQATIDNSDIILKPVKLCRDPFDDTGKIVLCETFICDDSLTMQAHASNTRHQAAKQFQFTNYYKPEFGIEQEYYLFPKEPDGGDAKGKKKDKQEIRETRDTQEYCRPGRPLLGLVEAHYKACLAAGLDMYGYNAANDPDQWEFQIGPCASLDAADQLWIARFILQRLVAETDMVVNFEAKPFENRPGSGCHINFSTQQTRSPQGYVEILNIIKKLEPHNQDYIAYCGSNSQKRLTGECKTFNCKGQFNWGVSSRNTAIRLPISTRIEQCGYLEDRRPSANMDPYVLTTMLYKQACLPIS